MTFKYKEKAKRHKKFDTSRTHISVLAMSDDDKDKFNEMKMYYEPEIDERTRISEQLKEGVLRKPPCVAKRPSLPVSIPLPEKYQNYFGNTKESLNDIYRKVETIPLPPQPYNEYCGENALEGIDYEPSQQISTDPNEEQDTGFVRLTEEEKIMLQLMKDCGLTVETLKAMIENKLANERKQLQVSSPHLVTIKLPDEDDEYDTLCKYSDLNKSFLEQQYNQFNKKLGPLLNALTKYKNKPPEDALEKNCNTYINSDDVFVQKYASDVMRNKGDAPQLKLVQRRSSDPDISPLNIPSMNMDTNCSPETNNPPTMPLAHHQMEVASIQHQLEIVNNIINRSNASEVTNRSDVNDFSIPTPTHYYQKPSLSNFSNVPCDLEAQMPQTQLDDNLPSAAQGYQQSSLEYILKNYEPPSPPQKSKLVDSLQGYSQIHTQRTPNMPKLSRHYRTQHSPIAADMPKMPQAYQQTNVQQDYDLPSRLQQYQQSNKPFTHGMSDRSQYYQQANKILASDLSNVSRIYQQLNASSEPARPSTVRNYKQSNKLSRYYPKVSHHNRQQHAPQVPQLSKTSRHYQQPYMLTSHLPKTSPSYQQQNAPLASDLPILSQHYKQLNAVLHPDIQDVSHSYQNIPQAYQQPNFNLLNVPQMPSVAMQMSNVQSMQQTPANVSYMPKPPAVIRGTNIRHLPHSSKQANMYNIVQPNNARTSSSMPNILRRSQQSENISKIQNTQTSNQELEMETGHQNSHESTQISYGDMQSIMRMNAAVYPNSSWSKQ